MDPGKWEGLILPLFSPLVFIVCSVSARWHPILSTALADLPPVEKLLLWAAEAPVGDEASGHFSD